MLAVVWHYWIAVLIAVPTILIIIAIALGYVYKVVLPRYPKR